MCNIIDKNALFTLNFMSQETDYEYVMDDNSTLYFQFCSYLKKKCDVNSRNSFAIIESADDLQCSYLTADQKWQSRNEDTSSGYTVALLDDKNPQNGVSLQIFDGDIYSTNNVTNVTLKYNIKFNIACSQLETATNKFTITNVTVDKNSYTVDGYSKSGCPILQFSEIWNYLSDHKIIFTIVLVIIGAGECFFGLKILPLTLFVIGYFTGFGVLIAILGEFVIAPGTNVVVVWVILIITVFFGLLLGYVTTSLRRLGFFFLGFWLGTVLAFLLNNAILYKINSTNVPLWVAIGVLGGFFGFLSCFFYKHIVIVSTATVGAYALIRPFGWIASGFPNEFAIAQQIRYNQLKSIPNEFYLFLSLILIMAAVGIRFQYYYYFKDSSLDEEFQLDEKGNDLDDNLLEGEDEEGEENEDGTKKKKKNKGNSKNIVGWVSGKIKDIKEKKLGKGQKKETVEMGEFNQFGSDDEDQEEQQRKSVKSQKSKQSQKLQQKEKNQKKNKKQDSDDDEEEEDDEVGKK